MKIETPVHPISSGNQNRDVRLDSSNLVVHNLYFSISIATCKGGKEDSTDKALRKITYTFVLKIHLEVLEIVSLQFGLTLEISILCPSIITKLQNLSLEIHQYGCGDTVMRIVKLEKSYFVIPFQTIRK